ncbi:RNA-guided endonuclease InsQ/TnpB family protein [Enterococcus sp. 2201sp1_2201st1_B8_2201SCRN_220225]|uniref:RNA-guided endonuclease InsQ/TnpB family protein n=1 Tax=unclassified Enterococcus TaxID=2608891 RepID=UPI0034A29885
MNVLKAYKFRLYPTGEQRKFFIETFGCVRFTYNALLKDREQSIPGEKNSLTPAKLKCSYPFLKQTDSLALSNTQRNLDRAFRNFYAGRCAHPKLKTKKNQWQSYTTNNQQGTIRIEEGQLKLPKLKSLVPLNLHREVKGQIRSATISAKNLEEFYVSLLCEEEVTPLPKTRKKIVLHFCPEQLLQENQGLKTRFCQEELQEKIAREERRLAIRSESARRRLVKLKTAKNYQKQKARVLELYRHKKARKQSYMDELSLKLVEKYDEIILYHASSQTGTFGSSDWQHFLQKVQYKARWYGKTVVVKSLQKKA